MSKTKENENSGEKQPSVKNLRDFRKTYLPSRYRELQRRSEADGDKSDQSVMADVFTRAFTESQ